MTVHVIVSVRDRAVNGFAAPFIVPSEGAAVRAFSDEVNRGESAMFAHPEDYDLYRLGHFDDGTGSFAVEEPHMLVAGKSVKRSTS